MINGSWSIWRRLTTAARARLQRQSPAQRQMEATAALVLLRQVQQSSSLRHLLTVAQLARCLPWRQRLVRQELLAAVLARVSRLPSPASPRSSSSRPKRARSTTRPRR